MLDLKAGQPPKPEPTPVPVPAAGAPKFDIGRPKIQPSPEPFDSAQGKPAPAPTPAPPTPEPVPAPEPAPPAIETPPTPNIQIVTPAEKAQQRAEIAQAAKQSAQISKFAPAAAAGLPSVPTVVAQPVLPNSVVTAHEAMQKLLSNLPAGEAGLPSTEVAPTALATQAKSVPVKTSLALASMVLAAMGAYIWFGNYPKMAVKIAGSRAGLAATYPSFLPSSYKLSGAVAYGAGEITFKLASPSSSAPLSITERETSWDSKSLYENYVKANGSDATTVTSQGLTIYFHGDKATWVNHGIWYIIDGTGRLNQEQILKIVYSL